MISQSRKGFTLMELMIVIAIIGILAGSLFPALTGYLSRARDTKKISEIKQLHTALLVYKTDTGGYFVPGTGYGGGGNGAINYIDGLNYTKTFFTALQELGYLAPNLKQKIPSSMGSPEITSNISPCNATPGQGQDAYYYYYDLTYERYAISAYLENPKQADIDNIVASYNGTGANGTCTYYGRNYSVGQN